MKRVETVGELIEILSKYGSDTPVFIQSSVNLYPVQIENITTDGKPAGDGKFETIVVIETEIC